MALVSAGPHGGYGLSRESAREMQGDKAAGRPDYKRQDPAFAENQAAAIGPVRSGAVYSVSLAAASVFASASTEMVTTSLLTKER
jgi:hypothetical protein